MDIATAVSQVLHRAVEKAIQARNATFTELLLAVAIAPPEQGMRQGGDRERLREVADRLNPPLKLEGGTDPVEAAKEIIEQAKQQAEGRGGTPARNPGEGQPGPPPAGGNRPGGNDESRPDRRGTGRFRLFLKLTKLEQVRITEGGDDTDEIFLTGGYTYADGRGKFNGLRQVFPRDNPEPYDDGIILVNVPVVGGTRRRFTGTIMLL